MNLRLRLALVYAAVLVTTATGLLALNYALLYRRLYGTADLPNGGPPDPPAGDPDAYKGLLLERQAAFTEHLRTAALVDTGRTMAVALVLTALAGLAVSWLVAGRLLRPLSTLTAATRRITHDRLHERVALTGPRDELKELADTFDAMVSRLESAFAGQRRFVADAAHELRTPLAVVRTGAEVQLAKRDPSPEQWAAAARRALAATGRAERLLDGLLALARSDSGVIAAEPHDLAVAAAAALGDADDEAERAGLTVAADLRPAPVHGDPALLDRLASNFVDNAVRHNRPGGRVDVGTGSSGGRAVLTVANGGPQVPAGDVDRLFEPFQRLRPGRAADARSTGLGLAIVRSIVLAHDGTVTAVPNPGGGLTVTVALPAARDAPGAVFPRETQSGGGTG